MDQFLMLSLGSVNKALESQKEKLHLKDGSS
jgi:hypothetical protein